MVCSLAWFARVSEKLQSSEGDYANESGGLKGISGFLELIFLVLGQVTRRP